MTYTILETKRITCDLCGKREEETLDGDHNNLIECEQWFIEDLKKQGWIYDKEKDMHYCPTCAKQRSKK